MSSRSCDPLIIEEDDIEWGLPSFLSFLTVEMPCRFLSFLYKINSHPVYQLQPETCLDYRLKVTSFKTQKIEEHDFVRILLVRLATLTSFFSAIISQKIGWEIS